MPKTAKKSPNFKGPRSTATRSAPVQIPIRPPLPRWEFALLYPGYLDDYTDSDIDALYEAGCADATISSSEGTISIAFHREAPSFQSALLSAIHDVDKSGVSLRLRGVQWGDN